MPGSTPINVPVSLLVGLEKLLNPVFKQALAQQGQAAAALEQLEGARLRLQLNTATYSTSVLLCFMAGEISLYRANSAETVADAWLEAPVQAYWQLLTSTSKQITILTNPQIKVGGNTSLLTAVQELAQGLGTDITAALNELIVATPAALPLLGLHKGLGSIWQWGHNLTQAAQADLGNYLAEEAGWLPGQAAWQVLQDASFEQRQEVERLEARLNLVRQQLNLATGEQF